MGYHLGKPPPFGTLQRAALPPVVSTPSSLAVQPAGSWFEGLLGVQIQARGPYAYNVQALVKLQNQNANKLSW